MRLQTDEEARAIDRALRSAEYRVFETNIHLAVRVGDILELLLRHRPNILHFSGHGTAEQTLIFEDANGNAVPIQGAALHTLLRILKDNIRCVVLNGCYTAALAAALAEVIDCVIGISDAVTDDASIEFSTAFYRALGYGRSVAEAFQLGQSQIMLAGMDEDQLFHLHGNRVQTTRFV
ncbi:MAG: CHAT domain-containing protein [Caldilineaceae bacterium]